MTPAEACKEHLGEVGRMISGSKKAPKGHICIWNANIIVDDKKVWFGDVDLTKDAKKLQKLAKQINRPLYILYEMGARFSTENKPDMSKVATVILPS